MAGIGTLVGMLVGAGLGGVVGERWHSELTRWAALGRGSPNPDQDDTEQASKAQERQPEHDIEGDRPGIGGQTILAAPWLSSPSNRPASTGRSYGGAKGHEGEAGCLPLIGT